MKQLKTIKLEGVSLNAESVAAMSKEDWLKQGKEYGYFTTIANKTATPEQQGEMLTKAYELSHKEMGTAPVAKPAEKKP